MTNATTTLGRYDIFLSYPSADRPQALALKTALETLGLSVWLDQERIDDAASIQRSIEHGLARSRLLVAWYSEAYARSRPCQWELTAALIVQQTETAAAKRVLVINPEPGIQHVTQADVRDLELIAAASGQTMAALAQQLKAAGSSAQGLLGDIRQLTRPLWHGSKKGLGSRRFVGRLSELWQVQNALTGGRYAIVTGQPNPGAATALASVRGGGGMGKSLLAEEYASRFGCFWPGGVFWIDALGVSDRPEDTPATLAAQRQAYYLEQLGLFASALAIDSQGLDLRQLRARLKQHLHQRGQPYLWLVDDLPACSQQALQDWLAPCDLGATLLTSRARQHEAAGTLVELGILPPDDAYALLCRERAPHNVAEQAAARSIVQRLGGHAMAVDQARAACARQGFGGFLARLDQSDQRALALSATLAGELPNGHECDIAKTFLGSLNTLSPDALALLTLSSQLSSAPISRDLISACKQAHDLVPQQASAADPSTTLLAAQDWADLGMAELNACSLADPAEAAPATPDAAAEPAITVHTLIARVVRWHLAANAAATPAPTQSSQTTAAWCQAAVRVLQSMLISTDDVRQHAALVHEVQHARLLCERVETNEQAALLERIATYDHVLGNYALACQAWAQTVGYFESVLGKEHSITMRNMSNLAITHAAMGQFATARTVQEWLLETSKRAWGEDHPTTLINMGNLASTLCELGEYAAAIDTQKQMLPISERVRGEADPSHLALLSNLAVTLQLMGEHSKAKALNERVLAAQRRVLGADHLDTLTSMNNLATLLHYTGDYAAARVLGEQALAAHRRVLGDEHLRTLTSSSILANAISDLGDYRVARAMHERVLAIRQRKLGDCHPDTLTEMSYIADTFSAMGEHAEARVIEESILEMRTHAQGEEHPNTLTALANLALTHRNLGQLPEARRLQERALTAYRRAHGDEHPGTLTTMGNLADTLRMVGELPAARAMEEQVLAIQQRVQGSEHPDALHSMSHLALTLHAIGDLLGASAMQERALVIQQRVLGPEHPDTLTSMNNFAVILLALGQLPRARAMQEKVLATRHQVLGSEHPDTVGALGNLRHTLAMTKGDNGFMAIAKKYPVTLAKLTAGLPES